MTREEAKQLKRYRPFKDVEECWNEMQKHPPFGWLCNHINNQYFNIVTISNGDITTYQYDEIEYYEYEKVFNLYTFTDGTPFGIKVEE